MYENTSSLLSRNYTAFKLTLNFNEN